MNKTGILYDNISGNTGDVAIGISLKKILRELGVPFDELIPGNSNPLDYETILVGGGLLLRPGPDFFYDKFRVSGNHILNAVGILGEPQDLDYLKKYQYITVRSTGDKKKLAGLEKEVHVIPCTTMLLEDLPDLPVTLKKPCIGIHLFPVFPGGEEDQFVDWASSLPFTIYFLPITHYNRDISYMRSLKERIPNAEVLPILSAQEIFTLAGHFDYFISCSLHGAIFSYVHNVPFLLFEWEEKMRFFMEDRALDRYLVNGFSDLRAKFDALVHNRPDYSSKIQEDKKTLAEHIKILSTLLPTGTAQGTVDSERSSDLKFQVANVLADNAELERLQDICQRQIASLSVYARNLEVIVADREGRIEDFGHHVRNLEQIAGDREHQISDLTTTVHNLETVATNREHQVTELTTTVHNLESIATDREHQITDLSTTVHNLESVATDREHQIVDLTATVRDLETVVRDREHRIAEYGEHTRNLEAVITDLKQNFDEYFHKTQELGAENDAIKGSIAYTLTTKFHTKVVERLLPAGTGRRSSYDLALSGARILVTEGWDRFWWSYHDRQQSRTLLQVKSIRIQEPEPATETPESRPVIRTTISVIIPTKNAGPEFPSVLEKIKNQQGIETIEIIVVDSGSDDDTRSTAEQCGCRVFPIQPEEFNHGLTRNYGAGQARGEYLVFMVQDAIPAGDHWLHDMVRCILHDPAIAAVSCRQIPRSDADLYACLSMQYHYRAMDLKRDRVLSIPGEDFRKMTAMDKRRAAVLDDVCTCFYKDTFDRYRFRDLNFAEDLDMGIRLLAAGHKLAFLASTAVIHSHNRDAAYFFRRSYVESKTIPAILGQPLQANPESLRPVSEVAGDLYAEYCQLLHAFSDPAINLSDSMDDRDFFHIIQHSLRSAGTAARAPKEDPTGFLRELRRVLDCCAVPIPDSVFVTSHVTRTLDAFFSHAEQHPVRCSREDLKQAVSKIFAIYAGARLGNLSLAREGDATMTGIDRALSGGV